MKTSLPAALFLVCTSVVALFFAAGNPAAQDWGVAAADQPYNLLVRGFQAGHLSLGKEVPPGFAVLANPYDPQANDAFRWPPYRLLDLSYYRGRFYLYFGPTPALFLLWPWAALTGNYLSQQMAVAVFCVLGFLGSAAVLLATARRHFPAAPNWLILAGVAALGLAPLSTGVLQQPAMYEVAIACAYAFAMLGLAALWPALHRNSHSAVWLAAASLAWGLAIASRPSLLFTSAVLLLPALREIGSDRPRAGQLLLAAGLPLAAVVAALAAYNAARFGHPLETGLSYQINPDPIALGVPQALPRFAGTNLYKYFFEALRWGLRPAFFLAPPHRPWPPGYSRDTDAFGILPSLPILMFAAGAAAASASDWKWLRASLAFLFAAALAPLLFLFGSHQRYELDFLAPLLLLALGGALALHAAGRSWRRPLSGAAFAAALLVSAAITAGRARGTAAAERGARAQTLAEEGRLAEALDESAAALRLDPANASRHVERGFLLQEIPGRRSDAVEEYREAIRLDPDSALAHYNLGNLQSSTSAGTAEAIREYRLALRSDPESYRAHNNLGNALLKTPRGLAAAVEEYRAALLAQPTLPEAHLNLGLALARRSGRPADGIPEVEAALRLRPGWDAALNARRLLLAPAP